MQDGKMRQSIIVLSQALPVGWYDNSKDGQRPVENVIIRDLITHIDETYRKIADRVGRGIEGFSMGGYGTLHLGFKYPAIFSAVSAIAPPLFRSLEDEPKERTWDTFFDDQAYYDQNPAWTLAAENAEVLRQGTAVRFLAGGQDHRLVQIINSMANFLQQLEIDHEFIEVEPAEHDYDVILAGAGDCVFEFWQGAFNEGAELKRI